MHAMLQSKILKPGVVRCCINRTPKTEIVRHTAAATQNGTVPVRLYSSQRKPNFFSQFIENIKQEMAKNKEMKESLKKFREEAEKLEQSEALQKARQKFQTVESEASRSTEVIKEKFGTIKEKVQEALEEAGKSEIAKKAGQIGEELGKSARDAAEAVQEKGAALSQSGAFRAVTQGASTIKKEIEESGVRANLYRPPERLRKRVEFAAAAHDAAKDIAPDTESTGIELHKDSRFYQSWQNFRDNNPYVGKILDWKTRYDESDNPVVRASRLLADKVSDVVGGLFQKTELSETMTELVKLDPNFDRHRFLRDCETDIIPNILEAISRGDLEVLRDWCHDAPYSLLSTPILQARAQGLIIDSKVLDVDNVDLAMGKMMDQGPVLVISFTSQQIICVKDNTGRVVEGDPEKIMRVSYVWVLCRDRDEPDPRAAWRLLDLSASSSEQLL
ncbi:mitochondrial import inner membrane translocase subunit TIM44 isoform X1 [Schistocerca cancellata]|uniref:mitochondrial import inner membrane translocase subunit TIM44 isoform X1 n=1 Tax=Schistocerca cancellata TaxID=274614 RepID=UPI0021177001|nr:mitochondrial import inner membrane translocase subunit TIM44 isoform X1 [Schistocerca cancellata]